ncbi:glutamate ABC transporter substrate-binding protein [Actinotalea caeni]|uniref:glutamate ABC transporter substrate-binding protein n=1 Tax=Actinotalea caeni TaxID=1348467 RepID=UPI0012E31303|nr:glutamate ABC transporter substrate-binding protein [Actinotalea caeni]
MRRTRLTMAAGALAIGALALAGCQSGGGDDGLTIGIKFDQPGLGFQDGTEYTGFDVDVARYVAEKLGYSEDQIEFVEAISANRETMLENGQVDMIFATYSITESRQEVVDFAGPYFVAGQDLLIRSEDAGTITGPESLNGLDLCSVSGSTSAQRVKDEFAEDVNLVEQPGYSQCAQFLLDGSVDAMTTDDIILAGLAAAQGSGNLQVVGNPFSTENYGVGIPEGSELCEDINAAITEMIEDGSWEKAVQANTEGTGYTPSAANPPTVMADCGGVPS